MTDVPFEAKVPRPIDAKALRRRMERAVERLLLALDEIDKVDEDLEPEVNEDDGTAEPSIGALELMHGGDQRNWTAGANDEREDEHDGAEPCEEGEPSLGSYDRLMNQVPGWQSRDPSGSDAEHDPAEGPEGDDEREHDPAEAGIADQEALDELKGGYV